MAQDVVSLLFAGDSRTLLPLYQDGVRRYRDSGGPSPERLVVAHGEEGLMVTLVWGDGFDHEQLGHHMLTLIAELGLPRPQATHGDLVTTSWADLTANAQA
jgi:hypothetical protein